MSLQHSQRKSGGLQQHYDLLSEKMSRLRQAVAIETDVTEKFKLENQIKQTEEELCKVKGQIEQAEAKRETNQAPNQSETNGHASPTVGKSGRSCSIYISIVAFFAIAIAFVVLWPQLRLLLISGSFNYQVRVEAKDTGEYLPNARVTIEVSGKAPLINMTDANGLAVISIPAAYVGQEAMLIVEAREYERYKQYIDLRADVLPQVVQLPQLSIVQGTPTPTFTPTPTNTPTPTFTPTPTNTLTPTSTSTPPPEFTQNFEPNNGTCRPYFNDEWAMAPSFESELVHEGSRSIRCRAYGVTKGGTNGHGGSVVISSTLCSLVDLSSATTLSVWVYDTQGGNSLELWLRDNNGRISKRWSTMVSVQNTWTKITWPLSGFTGIDKSRIKNIVLYEWWDGIYYFDDVTTDD